MGCEAQVHEKTNKRGTWAYHSVDGYYLSTALEHYHTHLCHIKTTNSERFTDTAQFIHQNIIKPTITHADKIMAAIADCNKAIKNMGSNDGADELKLLMKLTEKTVQNNKRAHASPRVHTAQTLDSNRPIKRNMVKDIPQFLRVPLTAVPRVDRTTRIEPHDLPPNNQLLAKNKARRRQHAQARLTVSKSAPYLNTRSYTRTMTEATSGSRPNTRASKRMSQLTSTTPAKHNKTTRPENAAAIEQCRNSRQLKQTAQ